MWPFISNKSILSLFACNQFYEYENCNISFQFNTFHLGIYRKIKRNVIGPLCEPFCPAVQLCHQYSGFFVRCKSKMSGALLWWLSMWTYNTGAASSNPTFVTKTPLVRKATGNHFIKSTSLEKNSEPCLWFLVLSKLSIQRNFLSQRLDFE